MSSVTLLNSPYVVPPKTFSFRRLKPSMPSRKHFPAREKMCKRIRALEESNLRLPETETPALSTRPPGTQQWRSNDPSYASRDHTDSAITQTRVIVGKNRAHRTRVIAGKRAPKLHLIVTNSILFRSGSVDLVRCPANMPFE